MNLRRNIFLVWHYSRLLLVLGAVYNLSSALVAFMAESYAIVFTEFIIKIFLTVALLYLGSLLAQRDRPFFYINLGLGRTEMRLYAIGADFLAFFIMCSLAILLRHA